MAPMSPSFEDVAVEDATRGLRKYAPPPPPAVLAPPQVNQSASDTAREFRRGLSAGDDLSGQSLWHYELCQRIGAGGMGVVYKAQHRWLGRTVAIKFLTLELLDHPEGLVRFAHEALAIGALDHPNIVHATDAGAYEGIHFLVTEFVEGPDLSKLVGAGGALAPAEACEIVRQAAIGLEHAHQCGLIHRDIKPSNLIVHHDGTVKLLDFGLARLSAGQTALTTTGQLVGTLDYLAPEQAVDSRTVDIRADIYSLGCTLYFLLSGRPPFAGLNYETAASKIRAHLADEPRPVAAGNRHLPLAVIDCLQRMMAKNPADRFATPGAVAAALAPFARGVDLPGLVEQSGVPGLCQPVKRPLADRICDRMTLATRALWNGLGGASRAKHTSHGPTSHRPVFSISGIVMLVAIAYVVSSFSCVPMGRFGPPRKFGNPFVTHR
jgi:serine/threonine protein kinase